MPRPRLAFHHWPAAIYAIGDVHGCLDQLLALEAAIAEDGSGIEGEKWLVTLGDHIDRGPDSKGAIEHVMGAAAKGFRRFALLGNHEQVMLDFLEDPDENAFWLGEGGIETLQSYGIDTTTRHPPERVADILMAELAAKVPSDHLAFMAGLPIYLALPGWLFVHAGIRPGVPLSEQTDSDLIWIRAPFLSAQLTGGQRIVHGHTPSREVVVTPHRICVDTACFSTGQLSAVRITPDGGTKFLSVEGEKSGFRAS